MAIKTITIPLYVCNLCSYSWHHSSKNLRGNPILCESCKSYRWNLSESDKRGFNINNLFLSDYELKKLLLKKKRGHT